MNFVESRAELSVEEKKLALHQEKYDKVYSVRVRCNEKRIAKFSEEKSMGSFQRVHKEEIRRPAGDGTVCYLQRKFP